MNELKKIIYVDNQIKVFEYRSFFITFDKLTKIYMVNDIRRTNLNTLADATKYIDSIVANTSDKVMISILEAKLIAKEQELLQLKALNSNSRYNRSKLDNWVNKFLK